MNTEQGAIMRFGYVSDFDPKRYMARIIFPDKDNLVSDWLPVLVHNSNFNKDENPLAINEHVLCIMSGNGIESGAVLGSIYDNDNAPLCGNSFIRIINFGDGTKLQYDTDSHELLIDCKGEVKIESAEKIVLNASKKIELTVSVDLTLSGNGTSITFGANSMRLDANNDIHLKTSGLLTLEGNRIKVIGESI